MFGAGLVTFNPKNFSGLKLWLDAANPSNNGARFTNGAAVSTWVDLSGISGNAIGAGAARPQYILAQQNGLPGMQYNGSQNMQVASLAIGSQLTLFVVSKSSNNDLFIEQSPDINSNSGFYIYGVGSETTQIKNGGNIADAGNVSNWLGTTTNLAMVIYDGSTIGAWKNGSLVTSNSNAISNITITDVLNIGSRNGASLFMTGYIFEIILYSGALIAGKIAILNDYLRRKWAIY